MFPYSPAIKSLTGDLEGFIAKSFSGDFFLILGLTRNEKKKDCQLKSFSNKTF